MFSNDFENTFDAINKLSLPESRIIPIAPIPFGVANAQIVSWFPIIVTKVMYVTLNALVNTYFYTKTSHEHNLYSRYHNNNCSFCCWNWLLDLQIESKKIASYQGPESEAYTIRARALEMKHMIWEE